jgi:hypothetical protein
MRLAQAALDPGRIDINHDAQVHFWCGELGVTPAELLFLVRTVGPIVDDIKEELARKPTAS